MIDSKHCTRKLFVYACMRVVGVAVSRYPWRLVRGVVLSSTQKVAGFVGLLGVAECRRTVSMQGRRCQGLRAREAFDDGVAESAAAQRGERVLAAAVGVIVPFVA